MATIVLDPGHGGTIKVGGSSPNNATGPNGLKEKEVTLKVALAAERALAGPGIRVVLTRRSDRNLGIAERAAVARDNRADTFVSIHFNAPGGEVPAQGTETWIGMGHSRLSRSLADVVQRRVRAVTGHRDRGVKAGNVSGVINPANHLSRTANCLIEISFLSLDAREEERLRQQSYIDDLGEGLAQAIMEDLRSRGLLLEPELALSTLAGTEASLTGGHAPDDERSARPEREDFPPAEIRGPDASPLSSRTGAASSGWRPAYPSFTARSIPSTLSPISRKLVPSTVPRRCSRAGGKFAPRASSSRRKSAAS